MGWLPPGSNSNEREKKNKRKMGTPPPPGPKSNWRDLMIKKWSTVTCKIGLDIAENEPRQVCGMIRAREP